MHRATLICWALLAVGILAVAPAGAKDKPKWDGEVGLLAGHHDNFFFRGPGAPAPSSDLTALYASFRRDSRIGKGKLRLLFDGRGTFVNDIDNADYQIYSVGVQWKKGPYRWAGTYSFMNNRLFSEEGDPVFFDENSFKLGVRRSFGRRFWARLQGQFKQWDFDFAEDDRDADIVRWNGTVRYGLTDAVAIRGSYLYETRDATSSTFNLQATGWSLALEINPSERVSAFLRFRERDVEYDDALPGVRNFQREDTIDDFILNFRWQVGRRWGIRVEDQYRDGSSTRIDRNFDGNSVMAGVFAVL